MTACTPTFTVAAVNTAGRDTASTAVMNRTLGSVFGTTTPVANTTPAPAPARKLSYKEQRELDELPDRIAALEAEQAELAGQLAGSDLYRETPQRIAEVHARHAQIDDELMAEVVVA